MRKYILPLVALGLLVFAVYQVSYSQQKLPPLKPPIAPAQTPFSKTVAGAGLVEAQTENISVGSALPGVVTRVLVKVGQQVKKDEPLFELDDRPLKAELKLREANLAAAEAQLAKQEALPRPEELPASEARVSEARANLAGQEDQLRRTRLLINRRVAAEEDLVKLEMGFQASREQLRRAEADHALLKAGAWEPDKVIARASVEQMKAQLTQTRIELERLVVRALVDGEVLQVNVRPGEFVGAPPGQALVVLGSVHQLHVRVDIDEHDIPRFEPGTPAWAMVRGHPSRKYPLRFVRVEPYVIPKKSLTGDNTERVDTRVLQVIYALDEESEATALSSWPRVYVGQQLDVFIESREKR
jgi:multidrug resistance efflux pump